MNVVIATPILYDETNPFNHLFQDIIQGIVDADGRVTHLVATESLDNHSYDLGVSSNSIHYIPFVRKRVPKGSIITRYLKDSWMNIRMAHCIAKQKDVTVLFEDVSYSSFWPVWVAKKKRLRIVAMLQDVWPDNAVESGLLKEGSLLYKFFEMWQKYVYRYVDQIICISQDMREFIIGKGVDPQKIQVIYNWGYGDTCVNIPWERNVFVEKYGLDPQKFYAVYAGNIGRMQNVQLVIEAARCLQSSAGIHFLIVGDGVMRSEIEAMTVGMKNVTMLPFQPAELATSIYSMAGVNIIPLVPGGLNTALPSKIGVCLSCGNPIIACVDKGSKLEAMLEEYKCGTVADPTDPKDLAERILEASQSKYAKNYRCFEKHFIRSRNVVDYVDVIRGK